MMLRPEGNGTLSTQLSGNFSSATLDETPIDPAIFMAATATGALGTAAAISIGLWGIYALIPFLTRMTPEHALKNDRRRALHDYIVAHPGATFREALRGASVAAGTGQHHIAILKRCGLLMVQRHRQTIRLFPNHGQFDQTWQRQVFLREPHLQDLYDLLDRQPGASQSSILDQAEGLWGWSRSTTQHRLSRLVSGGLAQVHARGRYLHYSTVAATERRFGLAALHPAAAREGTLTPQA